MGVRPRACTDGRWPRGPVWTPKTAKTNQTSQGLGQWQGLGLGQMQAQGQAQGLELGCLDFNPHSGRRAKRGGG